MKKNLIVAASESAPLISSGTLGDTVGALLSSYKDNDEFEIFLFIPRYRGIDRKSFSFEKTGLPLTVSLGDNTLRAGLYYSPEVIDGVHVYTIEHDIFFDRPGIYGDEGGAYFDNCHRFSFFAHALFQALTKLDIQADIIHAFEWQCALIPAVGRYLYSTSPLFNKSRYLLTFCSAKYQGIFSKDDILYTGLGWDAYTDDNLKDGESINFLKSGILHADRVTTISPSYADFLNSEKSPLPVSDVEIYGIANGTEENITKYDKVLPSPYSFKELIGKTVCKSSVQHAFRLPLITEIPLVAVFPSKDEPLYSILPDILGPLCKNGTIQCIIMGECDSFSWNKVEFLHTLYPENCAVYYGTSRTLEPLIYAGSDYTLYLNENPSTSPELSKSLALGSIPLLFNESFFKDAVTESKNDQNGFFISSKESSALTEELHGIIEKSFMSKDWPFYIKNAMKEGKSWDACAYEYLDLYKIMLNL
jgi:starch synthase